MGARNFLMLVFFGAGSGMYGAGTSMSEKVLLVIASSGFQPHEFAETKKVLEQNKFIVDVASDQAGYAIATNGEKQKVDHVISKIKNVIDYVGIFLIGGKGALDHLDNHDVYTLMSAAQKAGILWGAICISPRILCKAGLLENTEITGWQDSKDLLQDYVAKTCPNKGIKVSADKTFVIKDNLITANGPQAAHDFGQAIVDTLKNK